MNTTTASPNNTSGPAHKMRRWLFVVIPAAALAGAYGAWLLYGYIAGRHQLERAGFADEMPIPGEGCRVLVVAPHPDDEALGCGGLIRRALAAGAEVRVALMTNGDGSELAVIFGEKDLPLRPRAFIKLGLERQKESLRALELLGLPARCVTFLGYPNNGLVKLWRPEHWPPTAPYKSPYTKADHSPYANSFTPIAPYCGQQVIDDLTRLMRAYKPTHIFVTHPQDVHPDHWATARFLEYALQRLAAEGERWAAEAKVYGYLIHWPRWPLPKAYAPRFPLAPPPDLVAIEPRRWLKLELDPGIVMLKSKAVWCYRSQQPKADVLLPALIRANEAFWPLQPNDGTTSLALPPLGRWLHWRDERTLIHHLGGADITAAYVLIGNNNTLLANLVCVPRAMSTRAYVAVDLHGWDAQGRPLVATVYLRKNKPARVVWCADGHVETLTAPARETSPGMWTCGPVRLPPFDYTTVLLTCWGSVGDRYTDPAPWPGPATDTTSAPPSADKSAAFFR